VPHSMPLPAPSAQGGAVLFLFVMFFVRVNQVLVRLWTRAMCVGLFGLADVPLFGCMSDRESGLWLLRECVGFAPQRSDGEGSEAL
jgi:hypothetical protein